MEINKAADTVEQRPDPVMLPIAAIAHSCREKRRALVFCTAHGGIIIRP